jgi:hypothetical protein
LIARCCANGRIFSRPAQQLCGIAREAEKRNSLLCETRNSDAQLVIWARGARGTMAEVKVLQVVVKGKPQALRQFFWQKIKNP